MRFLARRAGLLTGIVLATCCILSTPARTGGAGFGDDDDTADDAGPSYFGFVRDSNGTTVPDAKVTVQPKDGGSIITRTDALGTYKVPAFSKEVDPKDVKTPCDKNGYRQICVVRRSSTRKVPKISIET